MQKEKVVRTKKLEIKNTLPANDKERIFFSKLSNSEEALQPRGGCGPISLQAEGNRAGN